MIAAEILLRGVAPAANRALARDIYAAAYERRVRPYRELVQAMVEVRACPPIEAAVSLIQAGQDGFCSLLIIAAVAELLESQHPDARERRYV
ncbi:MAG: hypothetical protein QM757_16500 [Paludibaculum sp.]